jgi:uncharacterized protein YciI
MLFCIRGTYRTDAPGLREQIRQQHLDYLKSKGSQIVLAGPVFAEDGVTAIGSHLIVEAPDLGGAKALVAQDPYSTFGLFAETSVQPFKLVFFNAPAV